MSDFVAQNKAVYNAIARQFSSTRAFLWDDLRPLSEYAQDGATILDIGCGNGRLYQLFEGKRIAYTGIDQSDALIDLARERFPNATFVVGEMTVLPFPDQTFDTVYSIAAFHHLPDQASRLAALGEMKRVVKEGGMVVMTNWNLLGEWGMRKYPSTLLRVPQQMSGEKIESEERDFLVPWKDGAGKSLGERYYHGFTLDEIAALGATAGLEVVNQYYVKKGLPSTQEAGENIVTLFKKVSTT